jgi:hypothetical protein
MVVGGVCGASSTTYLYFKWQDFIFIAPLSILKMKMIKTINGNQLNSEVRQRRSVVVRCRPLGCPQHKRTAIMVTVSAQSPVAGGARTLSGGNRKWLNAAILVIVAVLVVKQKSFIDSADEKSPQKRIPLLEDKIASLEAKLADLRAAPLQNGAINDCLLHVNHVRGIRIYSQNDEDGALLQTLNCMGGHGTKEYFEFGSQDGVEVNTRVLRDLYGWHGHLLDGGHENPSIPLHKEYFTPSNIIDLMKKYDVSKELDVLSVDCDMDDFYVTREILVGGYRPRVLINEFNINFGFEWSVSTMPKPVGEESDPKYSWQKDCYFGVSAKALILLAKAFGYSPVFANTVNLIFVRIDKAEELGLALPSPDIFPTPLSRALHPDCPGKTWKKIDDRVISKSVDPSVSHVEFANGMDEIVLDCITYKSPKNIRSSVVPWNHDELLPWRIFREQAN